MTTAPGRQRYQEDNGTIAVDSVEAARSVERSCSRHDARVYGVKRQSLKMRARHCLVKKQYDFSTVVCSQLAKHYRTRPVQCLADWLSKNLLSCMVRDL